MLDHNDLARSVKKLAEEDFPSLVLKDQKNLNNRSEYPCVVFSEGFLISKICYTMTSVSHSSSSIIGESFL